MDFFGEILPYHYNYFLFHTKGKGPQRLRPLFYCTKGIFC
jgi:hypothetical protein